MRHFVNAWVKCNVSNEKPAFVFRHWDVQEEASTIEEDFSSKTHEKQTQLLQRHIRVDAIPQKHSDWDYNSRIR
jgi:hypothetical protein